MPVLRSQTVYLSITVFLSLALSQQHTLLLSHVPCFVSASRCSCSLMCLLCLSITLLLLSHVPCFVSASRCSCFLMCLALSQHHGAQCMLPLAWYMHVPSFVSDCFIKCFACSLQYPWRRYMHYAHVTSMPCYSSVFIANDNQPRMCVCVTALGIH